jgi:hypothetical protein
MPNRRLDDDPAPVPDKLNSVGDFLARLTLGRVLLGLLFGAGAVMLYGMWETRAQWAPTLIASQALLIALLVGGFLIAVGSALVGLQKRVDSQAANLYLQFRDQLNDLRREGGEYRADLRVAQETAAERERLASEQMAQLIALEQECQRNLIALRGEVAELRRQTGFGDLAGH